MKYLILVGSLRKGSLNRKLSSLVERSIKESSLGEVSRLEGEDLNFPVYNQDIENEAIPDKVKEAAAKLEKCDGLIVCSPEYNGSISSPLKNTIDWISRVRPMPLKEMPVLLTGASPSGLGAMRGIRHARAPFEALGSYTHPGSFGLPKANEAFTDNDELQDSKQMEKLSSLIADFDRFCKKLIRE